MNGALPATAADASAWAQDQHSAMRLIAGTAAPGTPSLLRAGVEVKLAPGWKTYWRYPGDSGVPPHFDFGSSSNVESITVDWPAPHRFAEASGEVIGYEGDLILPLRITPADPTRPVALELKLDYAICGTLCIPVEANAHLDLAGGPSAEGDALAAAEQLVPRAVPMGEGSPTITGIRRDGDRVLVDVAAPAGMPIDLFAEGPTPDWALPLPQPVAAEGAHRFAFALDGLPPGASADGAALRLTLVSPQRSIEVTHILP
jgi:DsbC/DsbD-like thiol-disulfide interchange protein